MKIIIERFGPIKRFQYDLEKDFIVTYGNNNIGKSYAMQIVYLLIKTFISNAAFLRVFMYKFYMMDKNLYDGLEARLEKLVEDFIGTSDTVMDITETVNEEVNQLMSSFYMQEFMDSCKNTFGNLDKTLENNPCITIENSQFCFYIDLDKKSFIGNVDTRTIRLKKQEPNAETMETEEDFLDICVTEDVKETINLIHNEIQKEFYLWIKTLSSEYSDVYFLPASRSGIYSGMNAFSSIVAELSQNRNHFTKKIEFPGISEPISDYFISLANIKNDTKYRYGKYCDAIEKQILKGNVLFDKKKSALIYKPDNVNASYEMTEVSSMVSEVSPIVAFLKYVMKKPDKKAGHEKVILFIEEPEAHLHPNNQIALIEVFSKLIKENVKLVMSSHSNYVFNKLNNLVLSGDLDYHIYQPIVLEETGDGSESKNVSIDELGADDENFVDVSEKLYYEREEIIQKMNMEE